MLMENIASGKPASACRPVYVIDDDIAVRLSVTQVIEDMGYDVWSFPGGVDLLDALDALDAIAPGCLLLDVQMPGMTGIDVMEDLNRRGCRWPVIVMTAHGDVPKAVKAMKLGALEFIEKPFSPDTLRPALERGFVKWDEQCAWHEARRAAVNQLNVLTPRERSVLHGLMQGKQNKIVAHEMGLSVRTVEMHRANMLGKLGLRTLPEAVALLMRAQGGLGMAPASPG